MGRGKLFPNCCLTAGSVILVTAVPNYHYDFRLSVRIMVFDEKYYFMVRVGLGLD